MMNIAVFTFAAEARRRGVQLTHVREYVDNSAAEAVADRGRPHTEGMHLLTEYRYRRLSSMGLLSAVFRIASVDNDIADGLSRGGQKLGDALRMAAQAGLVLHRLQPDADANSIQRLLG